MSTNLLTGVIWPKLTAAARRPAGPSLVAVAYFGQGAAKLLPLRAGSKLVVDASDGSVKSGQTCPAELKKLARKGVEIYSIPNLHAKTFVFGRRAFIGSANVSKRSAGALVEAVIETSDRGAVSASRQFVRGLCRQQLGPEALNRLAKIYRPPRVPAGGARRRKNELGAGRPDIPTLRLAQLMFSDPPNGSAATQEEGRKRAKARRLHAHTHTLDEFFWSSRNCPFRVGDIVVQVTKQSSGGRLVSPPGNVIHKRVWRRGSRYITFVYLEVPNRRRVRLERLARWLGYGAKKQLYRDFRVRNRVFADKLLAAWER